jgi:predicted ATP-grasp superfamily ATP-dependent carboligase
MPAAVVLGQGMAGATSLAVVRDLGRSAIPVIALSGTRLSPARHSRYCTFRRCPDAEREPSALLDFLIAQARRHEKPCVLFATGDAQAWFVAQHACELRPWFRFADLPRDLLLTLLDKYTQAELVRNLGVAIPATVCPTESSEADCIAKQLGFPVFIKPRISRRWPYLGHNKGFVANNLGELRARLHWALGAGFEVLVQSIVQGPDTNLRSVYCYAGAGGREVACCYGILRKYPAGYGFGVFAESVDDPELARLALHLLRRIGLHGVAELEFKRDERDGEWRLIEINPRFALQHGLVSAAGANLASLAYFDLIGAQTEMLQYRAGVRWLMAGLDLQASLGQWRRGELGMLQWLRSFRGLRTEALFSRDDPGPALAYLLRSPRYLWEAAFRPPLR